MITSKGQLHISQQVSVDARVCGAGAELGGRLRNTRRRAGFTLWDVVRLNVAGVLIIISPAQRRFGRCFGLLWRWNGWAIERISTGGKLCVWLSIGRGSRRCSPNRCDVPQGHDRFSSRREPSMSILRICMYKFHLFHHWVVFRGALMASKIYRTWST